MLKLRWLAFLALSMTLCVPAAQSETEKPHSTRAVLEQIDVPGTNYTTVMNLAEIPPSLSTGRHKHPGVEVCYVLQGAVTLTFDDAPEQVVKAGQSAKIPAGTTHDVHNAGDQPAKLLVTWVIEKDQPMSMPVTTPKSAK